MALDKARPTQFRVDATYWKVGEMTYNPHYKTGKIIMYGFISQENREAGGDPIASYPIDVTQEQFAQYIEGTLSGAQTGSYAIAKELKICIDADGTLEYPFADSQDV